MNKKLVVFCSLAAVSAAAQAQSNVTLYGDVDEYFGYMRSSSGAHITGLHDGALLRSRVGLRGVEQLGGGYEAKFQLEGGFAADNGTPGDSARFFDRQTWVGINTPVAGEFRFGRQNTTIQSMGAVIDYTERTTFGSIINNFPVPSRYDNDVFYRSPRVVGLQTELHFALPENGGTAQAPAGTPPPRQRNNPVYQASLDFTGGPFRAGYMGLWASPNGLTSALPTGTSKRVVYHNAYFDFDYGKGKVYLAAVRSNNSTANANGLNATSILNIVSQPNNFFSGTQTFLPAANCSSGLPNDCPNDARRFYNIYQASADFRINSQWRVGTLWGVMKDMSHNHGGAKGGSIGGFYDMSKRTTLYSFANYMKNQENAGFRFSGSAAPTVNLVGDDVNGRRLTGVQLGILHRF